MADSRCNLTILIMLAFALWCNISKAQTKIPSIAERASAEDVIKPGDDDIEPKDTNLHNIDTTNQTSISASNNGFWLQYSVYPVPAKDHLYIIGGEQQQFALLNVQGVQVALVRNNEKIPLHQMAPGIYWLKPINENGQAIAGGRRIIKT